MKVLAFSPMHSLLNYGAGIEGSDFFKKKYKRKLLDSRLLNYLRNFSGSKDLFFATLFKTSLNFYSDLILVVKSVFQFLE